MRNQKRPVFLNLLQIKLPPTAIASILHRVAGVFLILLFPFLIYMFDVSLQDKASFTQAVQLINQPLVVLLLYGLLWAISHHFFAGLRYFLIDFDVICGKQAARFSAVIVVILGLLIPVLVALGGKL